MKKIFFKKSDFDFVKDSSLDEIKKLSLISEMIRYNTLVEVMLAGSGHLGASLSVIEVITVLYHKIMKVFPGDPKNLERDIFILSKGHACSSLYATLASMGYFADEKLYKFRQLDGLEGHADVSVPGVEANSGSLGMGISKAKGQALAQKKKNLKNRVFVMVGDGELQEGQNWEALQSALAWKLGNLVLLVDKNEVQTDKKVDQLLPMPPIAKKLSAFGWKVLEINGHNVGEIYSTLSNLNYNDESPKAVILKTIKGKGVSFMEHPTNLRETGGIYSWHAKIPNQEEFEKAILEIKNRIQELFLAQQFPSDFYPEIPKEFSRPAINFSKLSVVEGYSQALFEEVQNNKKIMVLDADLTADCGLRLIAEKFPDIFLEVGIAEQDMVSTAGGISRQGFLPIVNTFANFLTSRANEQIFNNQSENSKIIYVGHLAGLIPATPGKSHQAVRDIALLRNIPGLILCEPCCAKEAYLLLKYIINETKESAYLRLVISKGLGEIELPEDYKISLGKGFVLREGKDIGLISYGPILLPQTFEAANLLAKKDISAKVINLPWFNFINLDWLTEVLKEINQIVTIDNHFLQGGLGEEISRLISFHPDLKEKKLTLLGIEGFPKCGRIFEVLAYYGLDSNSLALKIEKIFKKD